MPRVTRDLVLPLAVIVLCLVAYYAFFLPRTLYDVSSYSLTTSLDYHSYFRPRFWLTSHELLRGRLPTWNPYEYGGMPLLATTQPAALYPPKALLFFILEPIAATWVFLVIHHVLAAGGFAWFLRTEGFGGAALFTGVAIWTFGTALLASAYHPTRVACMSWMPIAFVLAGRLVEKRSAGAFAALALVVTLQLLAGYPEFTIDLGLLLAFNVTMKWAFRQVQYPPWKSVPLLAGAFVLAAIAAGLQLLPLAEIAQVAQRIAMADKAGSFGIPAIGVDVPMPVIPGFVAFTLIGLFLPRARPAATGFALCFAISLGGWKLLRYLPGFSMVRFPLAWVFLASFFFGWTGAFGSDALTRPDGLRPGLRRAGSAIVSVAALALAALSVAAWYRSRTGAAGSLGAVWKLNIAGIPSLGLALTGCLGVVLLSLRMFWARRSPLWAWLLALGSLAGAHVAAYPHGATPAAFARPKPTGMVAKLHGRPRSIAGRALCPEDLLHGYEITDRVPSPLGVEISFLPWRYRQILERLDFIPGYALIDWAKVMRARGFWNAMDVQYMVTHTVLVPTLIENRYWPVTHGDNFMLFENRERMGHAWVNYAVRHVATETEALDYVLGRDFSPAVEVVLEEPTRRSYPKTSTHFATTPTREIRKSPVEVEFEVTLPRPGVFVVSESAYPGWEATVDGKPTPWLRANYVLRAVELDGGTHRVGFRYRPASVRWGAVLSAVGLGAIGALFLVAFRRRSRTPAVPGAAIP